MRLTRSLFCSCFMSLEVVKWNNAGFHRVKRGEKCLFGLFNLHSHNIVVKNT